MPRWWKEMSRTDAQQRTKGWPVAYLRMTEGETGSTEPVSLLRPYVSWKPGRFGRHAVELAQVDFQVTDDGHDMGVHNLMLSHDDQRPLNHKHPALWIHWGSLRDYLRSNSRQGWCVVVERTATPDVGSGPGQGFSITFQAKPPV